MRAISEATGRPVESLRPALFGDLERRYDRGEVSTEAFFRAAEAEAGLAPLPDDVWIPAWRDIFTPIPEALALLDALRPGLRTAIVSNTNPLHWDGVLRLARVDCAVDALALSFEVGAVKPEPAIFEAALARLGVTASEAVYADDRPDLVTAARALGLDAFVVDSTDTLGRELARRGLLGIPRPGAGVPGLGESPR